MKVAHRRTLWVHTVFSLIVCGVLGFVLWRKPTVPAIVVLGAIAFYVLGNVFIHARRDDLRQDTVIEYAVFGIAIGVVLVSALA